MNSKFLIFSFLFVCTVSATPSINEPCDVNEDNQLQPDPEHCNKFYQCSPSGWVSSSCPLGTLFNPAIQVCDNPKNVDCKDNNELKDGDTCDGSNIDELKPDPKNCSRFYECTHYGWENLNCSIGLYFNPTTLNCDFPENVDCKVETLLTVNQCDGANVDDLKPDPKNCSRFYQCTHYGWENLNCSIGLYFNPTTLSCDFPWNVDCAIQSLLKESQCDGANIDDLKPDPENCTKFYECTNYGWASLNCHQGLVFNPTTLQCDYPWNVECKNDIKKLKENECDGGSINQLKPDDNDCTLFYECTNYGWVKFVCPDGLYFNPGTSHCDFPDNVDCKSS